jgi:hypothetical protein
LEDQDVDGWIEAVRDTCSLAIFDIMIQLPERCVVGCLIS